MKNQHISSPKTKERALQSTINFFFLYFLPVIDFLIIIMKSLDSNCLLLCDCSHHLTESDPLYKVRQHTWRIETCRLTRFVSILPVWHFRQPCIEFQQKERERGMEGQTHRERAPRGRAAAQQRKKIHFIMRTYCY